MEATAGSLGSLFELDGKTAIVTGGASGLGRQIARGLDAFGASVVVADVDVDGAEETVADLGSGALAVEADVTDVASIERLRDRTLATYDSYEVVFNVPGINTRVPAFELSEERFEEILDLNLTGVFRCAKVLGRPLVEQGSGSVINMASALGLVANANQSAYASSKGGVVQLTKVLAAEWAPDVRVNAIAPGYMKTPLVREAMSDEEWYESMRELHLLDRFGDPEEVVGGAVYLASDASSFVTGSVLSIDGGWTAQ
ncbi:MAG: SDR family NAD(P)-dependent oxidoreductase [Salinigranum sp.]